MSTKLLERPCAHATKCMYDQSEKALHVCPGLPTGNDNLNLQNKLLKQYQFRAIPMNKIDMLSSWNASENTLYSVKRVKVQKKK